MGVPKFFRWLSERYPAISQLIAENRIPEFDCLYLDMNGIIHNCTHKDTGEDTTFRLSEEEMFIRIFNYIEHLFGKIKPKQLFFMAIDGVAPRAKMNQQRARRFRTALDAEKARDKAISEGVDMPKEPPFDSNCITPGTEFMAKLTQQLKYFVNKKVSEDADWQGCEIVLSGHEVPGEGEHKIMEYIRNAKAQPDYDPNVRHCLYGLDADLIMLGLLSHDPHFCLLREEVTFGRVNKAKTKELEHQNFYLLHLCIVREYLELEFQELQEPGRLSFPFDLERVIDDFILMAFFVGNDFLPNLPRLHINEGALAAMFRIYKSVLPQGDGYINEGGVINLPRLQRLLNELAKDETNQFENDVSDEKWFQSKKLLESNGADNRKPKGKGLVLTSSQRDLWKQQIRPYVNKPSPEPLDLGTSLNAADRKFVQDLADTLHIEWSTKEDDEGHRHLVLSFPKGAENVNDEEEEGTLALYRVMRNYDKATVVDVGGEDAQRQYKELYDQKYQGWKTKYYLQKFPEWAPEQYDTELTKLCENYVQGLQWVLYYYYRGIASWPWFYQYHYSPLTSDVIKGLGADLNFKLGQPFRPFEQLMGVLPDRSKSIVPEVYWDLMTNPNSPIYDFYPRDFELDMNGKRMEWEAVVKIPFIDEKRLLGAMEPKNKLLSKDQKERNGFGVALKFTYNPEVSITYPSSLMGVFPDISPCHCVENIFELPNTDGLTYRNGLVDGAKINIEALAGFPTLHTLSYTAMLVENFGVNVFQADSKNPSMIVTLTDAEMRTRAQSAAQKLGKRCFVGYPFLQEAKIVKVTDELFDYELDGNGSVVQKHHGPKDIDFFSKESTYIENWHSKRLGIVISAVESLVHVHMLKGLIKTEEGALIKEYALNPSMRSVYASQTIVDEVINEDERFIEKAAVPIEEEYPVGTQAFFLGEYNYGRALEVTGHAGNKANIRVSVLKNKEPDFAKPIIQDMKRQNRYTPSYAVAKMLNLHPLILSKILSSYQVNTVGGLRVNLGLNLKFDAKKQKVLGYSQKSDSGWEFSNAAIELLARYIAAFPDFFAAIQQNPQASDVSDTDLWKDPKVAAQRVKEIGAWLKAAQTSKFERVPLEAEQLDSVVVMKLAEAGAQVFLQSHDVEVKNMKGVPRSAIMKPSDAELFLSNQKFALGDRVSFLSSSGKVPLGSRGTVVGLSRTATNLLLDVVWDLTFMSGTTLGERAPPFRGMTVASSSVLNTTYKQVVSGSKAGMQRKPVPAAASLTTMAAGVPQYKDAPAPGPLRGTWRGAANGSHGQSNRGRGRGGGPNLLHSTLVYRPHQNGTDESHEANGQGQRGGGNFRGRGRGRGGPIQHPGQSGLHEMPAQPQQPMYGNVPPPANLDTRGRGRGRGGRGGRGRGAPRGRGANGAANGVTNGASTDVAQS
ncbi:5'-3' exoribonuclease [Colletotrichum tofieldiae]|uniref:5'-3' exoribonuclease 1 n=1 Tax=Colletotrichum tofieldiae TaxID=708197 RepID=A0A166TLU3_9PEZI|nr:5'-3' exoribonuclease [Colletotrichum tofieldiae]GKT58587.1 5'-3' exoribonuclease [Colletotrichum tofieldiae]GKT77997.1 5'-3' exoribonuclease [Colletotrichum tofieldiae]